MFFVFVLGWFFVVGLGFWLGCVFEGLVSSLGVLLCLVFVGCVLEVWFGGVSCVVFGHLL